MKKPILIGAIFFVAQNLHSAFMLKNENSRTLYIQLESPDRLLTLNTNVDPNSVEKISPPFTVAKFSIGFEGERASTIRVADKDYAKSLGEATENLPLVVAKTSTETKRPTLEFRKGDKALEEALLKGKSE